MEEIERLDIDTDKLNIEIENEKVSVSIKEKENHTLSDLIQKLINYLYDLKVENYDEIELKLLECLLKKEKTR